MAKAKAVNADFMFQCNQCKEFFTSSSVKGCRELYKKHAKKHTLTDFPLRYIFTRWMGRPLNTFAIFRQDGKVT